MCCAVCIPWSADRLRTLSKRFSVRSNVKAFLCQVQCRDMRVLELALDTYGARSLDFVDCVLYAYHVVKGAELATFDKKLLKLLRQRSE